MDLGQRIKKIRLQYKFTQQEVADLCGFTKGLLSKIEHGKVIPPIATLSKLAKAFGVKVSALLEDNQNQMVAYTKNTFLEAEVFSVTDKGYAIFAPAAEYTNKKMQPIFVIAKKGKVKKHSLTHEGEEYIYVLKGEIKFKVANTEYELGPGESLYFDSLQVHGMEVVNEEAQYLNFIIQ